MEFTILAACVFLGALIVWLIAVDRQRATDRLLADAASLIDECHPGPGPVSFLLQGCPAVLDGTVDTAKLAIDLSSLVPSGVVISPLGRERVRVFDKIIDADLFVQGPKDEVYSIMSEAVRTELRAAARYWPHFPQLRSSRLTYEFTAQAMDRVPAIAEHARLLIAALQGASHELPERLLAIYELDTNFELGRRCLHQLLQHHGDSAAAERARQVATTRGDFKSDAEDSGRLSVLNAEDELGQLSVVEPKGALSISGAPEEPE